MKKPQKTKRAKDVSINDLGGKVDALAGRVDTLTDTVDTLAGTVDNLAIMVAKGFERVDGRFGVLEQKVVDFEKKTEDNFRKVRQDILETGDRFVSRYEFDNTLVRISRLEEKLRHKAGK